MRALVTASVLMEGDTIRDHGQWFTITRIETTTLATFGRRLDITGTYDDGAEAVITLEPGTSVYLWQRSRVVRAGSIDWRVIA